MSCKNKSARIELITLKKPTALDKVIEKVPKPNGAIPTFGLPKWKTMSLESKIPMVPGPEGAYNFSRRKLGKKLWIGSPDAEFNLSDPCNYEMELQYEGFHDEHLTDFYKRPINIQRMIKLGFVTENLDPKCSLKDYNMYRKYLKKLHNDSVTKELKKKAELCIEMKDIKFAEDKARIDLERLSKRENAGNFKEMEKIRKEMRENKLKSRMRKYKDKLKQIEQTRREDLRKRIAKREAKMEKIKQIHEVAAKLERRKLLKILTDCKRKESERIKMRTIRLMKEEKERKEFIQHRWKMKQQLQIQQLEREEFLRHCINQERQMFIQKYNKKIKKERKRMEKRIENSRKFVKCYIARNMSKHGRITCCKIPKACQGKSKHSNSETTNSETIRKQKCSKKTVQNNQRKHGGKKKRGKKLKTNVPKIKGNTSGKKSQDEKPISKPETNESIESDKESVSCSQIIRQDDTKSKCECEQVKFLKRYEIFK